MGQMSFSYNYFVATGIWNQLIHVHVCMPFMDNGNFFICDLVHHDKPGSFPSIPDVLLFLCYFPRFSGGGSVSFSSYLYGSNFVVSFFCMDPIQDWHIPG